MDRYDEFELVGQSLLFRLLDDYYNYKNEIKLGLCIDDPEIHSNYKNRILTARQLVKEDTVAGLRLIEAMSNLLEKSMSNLLLHRQDEALLRHLQKLRHLLEKRK